MPLRLARYVLLGLGALGLMPGVARADLAAFLDQVVAAHGGGASPTAIVERGQTESTRRGTGAVTRWWQAPDRFRIEIEYPGAPESRLLRGADAWQHGRPATAAFRGALVLQAARMALPWRLRDRAAMLVDRGELPDGRGGRLRTLEWEVEPGMRVLAEFNGETHLLQRSRGLLNFGGSSMEFATVYEDYRLRDGRRVAMIEHHYAMGQYVGSTRLEQVEFPAVLPAPTFDPAPSGQRVGAPAGGVLAGG